MRPDLHEYIALVTRFHSGNGGIHGPWWLVVPLIVIGVGFRLWQLYQRRRR